VHDIDAESTAVADAIALDEPPQIAESEPAPPAPPPVEAGLPEDLARYAPGRVHLLGPFEVPGLGPRHLRLYLPRAYDPDAAHFVLSMFDGQNVFDDEPSFAGGWHLHAAVEQLAGTGKRRPRRPVPIVLGIDHGHDQRILELSPFAVGDQEPKLDLFLDWLTGNLLPALGSRLQLVAPPLGAVIGGSSMGGLAALYAHFRRPEAFGGALVMSPSFWVAEGRILGWVADQPTPPLSRVYLDCGAREGRGSLLPIVAAMAAHLAERGYGADQLLWRPDAKGTHSEACWRRRLPKALRFFYR
jgi:predicted alpha/beta superfamily hydrolase